MQKGIIHEIIYEPVFRTSTHFYVCKDGEDAKAHAKKTFGVNINGSFDGCKGMCVELTHTKTKGAMWFIWLKRPRDWKCLVHEVAHLVFHILEDRGVRYTGGSSNNETFCYLQEYFITEFWDVMKKK